MSETCRVIINQVKQKLHLVGYLLIRYFKDARYHEHKKKCRLCKEYEEGNGRLTSYVTYWQRANK